MWGPTLREFRKWMNLLPDMWTDLRLVGFALKTNNGWQARRVLLSLNGPCFAPRVLRTDNVLFFEYSLPYASMPRLILSIARGILPRALLAGTDDDIHLFQPGGIHLQGQERSAGEDAVPVSEMQKLPRFELEFIGQWDERGGLSWDLHRKCDRELLAKGHGRINSLAVSLGLAYSEDGLDRSSNDCSVKIVACIPSRIAELRQTADRHDLVVKTDIAPQLAHRVELTMTPLRIGWRDPSRKGIDSGESTVFALPADGDVLITLLVDGYPVHSIEFERLPSVRPRLRERAIAAFEGRQSLLAEGLIQPEPGQQTTKLNSNAFERSVLHLFGLIGFSGFWWGPNRMPKNDKLPMPDNASDCLAFSPDDSVIALLECTVEAPGRDKATKLIQRANDIERGLAGAFGNIAVVPVLVVASSYAGVTNNVKQLIPSDGLELIAREQLAELMEVIKLGGSDMEIEELLPNRLRSSQGARRLFARLF